MTTEPPEGHKSMPADPPLALKSNEGLGRAATVPPLSIEVIANATKMVRAFGCTAAQAAAAFAALGKAANALEEEDKALRAALRAKQPWYRRSRW
jgi:DNA-binding GntR family transcriptional regulator